MFSNSSSTQMTVVRDESSIQSLQALYHERKEAIHFLRNIRLGEGFAILDRHILRNLNRLGVIPEIPATITKKRYLEIEEKLRRFAAEIGIPIADLDLLFWSRETGWIFK